MDDVRDDALWFLTLSRIPGLGAGNPARNLLLQGRVVSVENHTDTNIMNSIFYIIGVVVVVLVILSLVGLR